MRTWGKLLGKNSSRSHLLQVPLKDVQTSPYQPRQEIDEIELRELAGSIHEVGLIQPIVVRKVKSGYELVAGERRFRACQLLGLTEIPAILMELDDKNTAALSLIENLQRKNLNYFEEAKAYARLINDFGFTQEEVARKAGKSQSGIANKLRLLKLSPQVQKMISPDVISERHARALLKLNSDEEKMMVLQMIYEQELNVRETEEFVERIRNNLPPEMQKKERKNRKGAIKDAQAFLKTLQKTIIRAKNDGVDMMITEREYDEAVELVIRIPKPGSEVNRHNQEEEDQTNLKRMNS
ncbi:MAG: ParB/RepB/Spo0J family partition protein [Syntrophomonadaceae bacterium]|nr:ParB/RepB/Spo0J family partition protein [Syntrophomonadaceae bacterium]